MKKRLLFLFTVGVIFALSITGYAKTVDDKNMGIAFIIPNTWNEVSHYDDIYTYQHSASNEESISISKYSSNDYYWIEQFDEESLKRICSDIYSDSNLANSLTKTNGVFVTVKTESVLSNFEYYNNRKFYRYEKAYTASALGRKNTPFYDTILVTVENGMIYCFEYSRNYSEAQHFSDLRDLLYSLSFESGAIKIKINGTLIYPDSAPILYNDRTLVPIRAVAEKMNYSVAWDGEKQLVALTSNNGKNVLHFQIGSDVALKNLNKIINLDVPAMVVGNRTYLPLRAVAESMDANVNWNGADRTVEINY